MATRFGTRVFDFHWGTGNGKLPATTEATADPVVFRIPDETWWGQEAHACPRARRTPLRFRPSGQRYFPVHRPRAKARDPCSYAWWLSPATSPDPAVDNVPAKEVAHNGRARCNAAGLDDRTGAF